MGHLPVQLVSLLVQLQAPPSLQYVSGIRIEQQMMKHNIAALAVFLLGCVAIVFVRPRWIKRIHDTSDPVLDAVASRIVLDLVLAAIFAWEWVRIPEGLHPIYLKLAFMTAILFAWYAIRRILRWKLQKKESK